MIFIQITKSTSGSCRYLRKKILKNKKDLNICRDLGESGYKTPIELHGPISRITSIYWKETASTDTDTQVLLFDMLDVEVEEELVQLVDARAKLLLALPPCHPPLFIRQCR